MPEERQYFSRSCFMLGGGQGPAELTLECVPTTWLTLRYLEADGETGVGGLPWRVTFDDGTVREGELDRHGEAYLTEVPSGPVEVEFSPAEEDDEARLAELRAELKAALDAEVARAQSEGDMYRAQMAKTAGYEKPFIYTGAALVGTWEWIEDTVEGLYTLAESGLSTAFHSAQWVTQYMMHMDALNRAFVRGDEREVRIQARALNQMMQEVEGALKADLDQLQDLSLLAWDDETREMLVDFPVRYFKAIDGVNATRMTFRYGIDAIIIVAGLAAGGAGIAWGVLKFGSRAANITKKMMPILKRLRHRKTVREPDVNRRVEVGAEGRSIGFTGTYKGKAVRLKGIYLKRIKYKKRSREELRILRGEFNRIKRKEFVASLANNPKKVDLLIKAGLGNVELRMLKDGKIPPGWQVHHKLPLDDGGTNDFSNLVLIRNAPEHSALTTYQAQATRGMSVGEIREIDFPIPKGIVYPVGGE